MGIFSTANNAYDYCALPDLQANVLTDPGLTAALADLPRLLEMANAPEQLNVLVEFYTGQALRDLLRTHGTRHTYPDGWYVCVTHGMAIVDNDGPANPAGGVPCLVWNTCLYQIGDFNVFE